MKMVYNFWKVKENKTALSVLPVSLQHDMHVVIVSTYYSAVLYYFLKFLGNANEINC